MKLRLPEDVYEGFAWVMLAVIVVLIVFILYALAVKRSDKPTCPNPGDVYMMTHVLPQFVGKQVIMIPQFQCVKAK